MLKVRKSVGESIDKLLEYFDRFDQDLINGSDSISHDFDMIILVFQKLGDMNIDHFDFFNTSCYFLMFLD